MPTRSTRRAQRSRPPQDVSILLLAAGEGRRLGKGAPKGWISLAGRPLLIHAIERFQSVPGVLEIIAVVHPNIRPPLRGWLADNRVRVPVRVVPGGRTRQESVSHGLEAMARQARYVVTHDVARPLIALPVIEEVLQRARRTGAAVLATPVTDTLVVSRHSLLRRVLDRSEIAATQTPQAFSAALLKSAHEAARRSRFVGSDEGSLVARMGRKVSLVWNDSPNLKITLPHDIPIAETLLKLRP